MKVGSVVVVLGELDQRIRDKTNKGSLVIGTLDAIQGEQAVVILPDGDIWRGNKNLVRPVEEQV